MTIGPDQIKAARELLGWSRPELAKRVHIAASTLGNIENGKSRSTDQTLLAIKQALEAGGVEIAPWSVRLRDENAK
jgi:transcriptional regulator with XRE-family HTH domain